MPWLYYDGYVVYRYYDGIDKRFYFSFQKGANSGYYDWQAMVRLKGLDPSKFVTY